MNLTVFYSRYGKTRAIAEPRTKSGKPRCQMTVTNVGIGQKQCDRPASFFEPHHDRPFKHSPSRKTTAYIDGKARQLYGDDVLFGYCKQHSMTVHDEEYNARAEASRQRQAAAKARNERINEQQAAFKNLIIALEKGNDSGVWNAYKVLRDTGVIPAQMHLDARYL